MLRWHRMIGVLVLLVYASLVWGQSPHELGSKELWSIVKSLSPLIPPKLSREEKKQAQFGKELFFDKRFSKNNEVSCSSCHIPGLYFTDGQKVSKAIGIGNRNTPSLVNSFALTWGFWDGRVDNIASQALKPVEDPREHGTHRLEVYGQLLKHYQKKYEEIFGPLPVIFSLVAGDPEIIRPEQNNSKKLDGSKESGVVSLASKSPIHKSVTESMGAQRFAKMSPKDQYVINRAFSNFGLAIAQFERTLVSVDAPFDRFVARWKNPEQSPPLSHEFGEPELNGLKIFVGKGLCMNCHHGPDFSDHQFHNIGMENSIKDLGRSSGVLAALRDPFGCDSPYYKKISWINSSEACQEKEYIIRESSAYKGAFKTPSLRNVEKTAPYGHNGSLQSLADVIEHYSTLPDHPNVGHRDEILKPLLLKPEEKADLERFLRSLSADLKIGP